MFYNFFFVFFAAIVGSPKMRMIYEKVGGHWKAWLKDDVAT